MKRRIFEEITEKTVDDVGPPPITGTPGDLLVIFKSGTLLLETTRDTEPDNFNLVLATAAGLREAIDVWIALATEPEVTN